MLLCSYSSVLLKTKTVTKTYGFALSVSVCAAFTVFPHLKVEVWAQPFVQTKRTFSIIKSFARNHPSGTAWKSRGNKLPYTCSLGCNICVGSSSWGSSWYEGHSGSKKAVLSWASLQPFLNVTRFGLYPAWCGSLLCDLLSSTYGCTACRFHASCFGLHCPEHSVFLAAQNSQHSAHCNRGLAH